MIGTTEMLDCLRREGYAASAGYLQYLLRDRVLRPPARKIGGSFVWEPEDVERLRPALRGRGRGPCERSRADCLTHENGR